ncbi:thermonuclease family protein [Marinobacterium weihaiense]|uniref:Thermonuclease family protein n=1 Tax=Marinobacterium weihaiense TaxID=2851016 RepID=A0ABS6MDF2_9GAMM|nr:thermonuclease family protein [Marinobacterium weihaiense]MBV0934319.1 thermonuclease family protein [Marinobacterium weihaiense]
MGLVSGRQALAAECPRLPGGFQARVEQVYDGDTLRLSDGRKVRLVDINTPELGRDGRADEPHAEAARQWLRRAVQGRRVYLLPGAERADRYGRRLAHLYLPDGTLAAELLVARGLGYVLARSARPELTACLFAAETSARRAGLGVWQSAPLAAERVRRSGFAVLQGRISRITPTRRGTYIDLDDHLAVFVSTSVMAGSPRWQIGRRLQVRGWVVDRLQRHKSLRPGQQRWRLDLTHSLHLRGD